MRFCLLLFVVLLAAAQAASYSDLAAFQAAADAAGATAQSAMGGDLAAKFAATCAAGVGMSYTTVFSGATQTLALTCATPTLFNEATCTRRLVHAFLIANSCVAGDALTVAITNGPPADNTC